MTQFFPFYYDEQQFLTNQKCFIITGMHIAYLTAFFNSVLFKYCFTDNFPTLQDKGRELSKVFFDKIRVKDVTDAQNDIFVKLVEKVQDGVAKGDNTTPYGRQIDALVYELYGITSYEELLEIEGDKDKALEMLILITHYRHPDATDILPLLPEDIASSDTILPIIANMRKQGMIQ